MRETGRILQDIGIGKGFRKDSNNMGYNPADTWDDVKLKSFYAAEEAIGRVERQLTEREKIPASSDRRPMSKNM